MDATYRVAFALHATIVFRMVVEAPFWSLFNSKYLQGDFMPRFASRYRQRASVLPDDFSSDPRTQLWILRSILAGDPRYVSAKSLAYEDADILWAAGLSHLWPAPKSEPSPDTIREAAFEKLESLQNNELPVDAALDQNVLHLAGALHLNDVECALLSFGTRLRVSTPLAKAFANRESQNPREIFLNLSWILDCSVHEIRMALGPEGSLREVGLMQVARQRGFGISVEVMEGLEDILLTPHDDAESLLGQFFQQSDAPKLEAADYRHMAEDLTLLQRFLEGAHREKSTGVNILLHGPPGTGKTELARVLAKSLAADAFDIKVEDRDGDSIDGGRRCAAFRLCQRILSRHTRALVIFDEIEDAFPSRPKRLSAMTLGERDVEKGWVNRLLESNPVPAIWISNSVAQLDPAMLRRFDLVVELRSPPQSVRRGVVEQHLGSLGLSDVFLENIANQNALAPADIASLGKVAKLSTGTEALEPLLARALAQRLKLSDQAPALVARQVGPAWNPAFVQSVPAIEPILEGLCRTKRGRILLYGPPGTGKTALAKVLAQRCDLPLMVRPASSLLSKWVGDSEKSIASMFAEAKAEGALLLLDEADSFLRDRRDARASWEVTRVNEMLMQMEHFEGLFICSTNLVDGLDDAAFRRFDLKIRFEALNKKNRVRLLQEACCNTDWETGDSLRAESLRGLTPGDVSAALRRFEMLGEDLTPDALLSSLEEDLRLKSKSLRTPVGF